LLGNITDKIAAQSTQVERGEIMNNIPTQDIFGRVETGLSGKP
jgi:hypothetical protein